MTTLKPPQHPDKNPILGDIPRVLEEGTDFYEALRNNFQDIARFRYVMKEFYWVNHPDYIREVLTSPNFERSLMVRKFMGAFLGAGVFTQEGKDHIQSRALMLPSFHKKRISQWADMFVEYTEAMLDGWQAGDQRDMSEEMMKLTLQVVSTALFGQDASDNAEEIKASLHLIQDSIDGTYPFYAALAPDWFPVMRFGKVKEAIDNFQNKTKALIEARRQSGEDAGDLLSMLLLAEDDKGKSMTTEQVVGQVASLLFAGHETTANGLSWLWYALARNPQVQDKLLAEIDTILEGRRATFEDLPNLSYSRMVIDEMLRLYPPAWYTERTPREDVQFGEYLVPAGTPVVVTVIATHRDPRYFDNPLAFIPERFAPENQDSIQKFTYLPFGSGTHRCMGDNFALLEMQLIMITMLQRFTYAIPNSFEIEPRPIVTLGIEGGLPVTVSAR